LRYEVKRLVAAKYGSRLTADFGADGTLQSGPRNGFWRLPAVLQLRWAVVTDLSLAVEIMSRNSHAARILLTLYG
jgi:hypothetical protein